MAFDKKTKKDRDDVATWEKIPMDLWDTIFKKLVDNSLLDSIRFSAVCSMFRSIASSYPKSMYRLSSPFLLMPRHDSVTHDLFSMSDDGTPRIYPFSLPELQNRLCVGSSYGWLITLCLDSSDIGLLNPVNRATISLPRLLSYPRGISKYRINDWKHKFKASISTDPSTDRDFTVTVMSRNNQELYICRGGDREWTSLKHTISTSFQDFIGNMGTFYAIDDYKKLLSWDDCGFQYGAAKMIIKSPAISGTSLLVNSPDGDLLMVHLKHGMYSKNRHQFSVFKLDKEKNIFVGVTSLGNEALLLGFNPSRAICVSTVKCPQYLKNCIYYTQHHQVFVYNMGDMTNNRVYKHNSRWYEPCIWVTPTIATATTYVRPQDYDARRERASAWLRSYLRSC